MSFKTIAEIASRFEAHSDEYWVKEGHPLLVLAILRGAEGRKQFVPSGHPFIHIFHQTAGIACHHVDMDAIVLTPKPRVFAAMQLIEKHWFESCAGAFGTSLDELNMYRMQLKTLVHPDLDCNQSYTHMEEGIYPVDVDVRLLRELVEEDLPDDLDSMLTFESDLRRCIGMVGRWKCFMLAENSD
jgi:hypothetical protein